MSDDKVRDALAEAMCTRSDRGTCQTCEELADAILASDVLATIKADAQREVADAVAAMLTPDHQMPSLHRSPCVMVTEVREALAPYRAERSA